MRVARGNPARLSSQQGVAAASAGAVCQGAGCCLGDGPRRRRIWRIGMPPIPRARGDGGCYEPAGARLGHRLRDLLGHPRLRFLHLGQPQLIALALPLVRLVRRGLLAKLDLQPLRLVLQRKLPAHHTCARIKADRSGSDTAGRPRRRFKPWSAKGVCGGKRGSAGRRAIPCHARMHSPLFTCVTHSRTIAPTCFRSSATRASSFGSPLASELRASSS